MQTELSKIVQNSKESQVFLDEKSVLQKKRKNKESLKVLCWS